MTMKIYTKTGDRGETSLVGGERVLKDHPRLQAYGDVDELNATIGLILTQLSDSEPDHKPLIEQLLNIQNRLFNIGSLFACPEDRLGMVPPFEERWVSELEQAIDTMDSSLSPLKNFILPSGHISSVYCHLARTVCRRCERHSIPLLQVESLALSFRYLNRLSDYFFALARYLNHLNNVSDNEWKK